MARRPLRLAAAQSAARAGDVAANLARHADFVRVARAAGADLLLFPELSLSGYEPAHVAACALAPDDARLAALVCPGMQVIVGAPLRAPDPARPFIGSLCLHGDGRRSVYRKQHLHPGEEAFASAGPSGASVFEVQGVACAQAICADISQASHPAAARAAGADVYLAGVLISVSGYAHDAALLQGHAAREQMLVLMANHGAPSGGYDSAGRSACWDAQGRLVAALPGSGEALLLIDVHADGHTAAQILEV
ncbi:carbon-nitrogen hydrolase family protein [Massilia sp. TS11]|uniref:carbon-nitrogen hydrolase family protein n=1 Tax=Massilia sp. TS11 TaxID=2908003 RepID=UPI001EDBABD2|nr:carbon-nitrogen hydrolase family protein [Massilia sp. TS11]MCG2585996.1 carbon-nitrogen hydrolase family protein [Massilia sp. TS11]